MTDETLRPPQRGLAAFGVLFVCLIAASAMLEGGGRLATATFVGALAGVALYHAAFGFTAGWRRFIRERRSTGLVMQLLLVGLTAAVALPLIHYGDLFGVRAGGFVFPIGVAVVVGAFLFGFGMQLGGGCGSGTLFTVGGGSTRMVITLAFFILGGLIATFHWTFWQALPRTDAISLATPLGVPGALAVTLLLLGALALAARRAEIARHGSVAAPASSARGLGRVVHGPWSMLAGALVLTVVGALTLLVLGRPWGITSGLTLWGAQMAHQIGVSVASYPYWENAMGAVEASIFAGGTSVMNLGLIFGAFVAAALAGRFAPATRLSGRDAWTAVVGGFLMGYGARLAFGCNIGALLGGIASGSVHGWVWFAAAFVGSILGVRVRAAIGMDPPLAPAVRPADAKA